MVSWPSRTGRELRTHHQPATPAATDAATETAAATPAAPATGWDRAALGLREQQLLEADLLGIDGVELGPPEGRPTT